MSNGLPHEPGSWEPSCRFEGLHRIDDKDDSDELLDKTQYGRLIYVAGLAPSFSVNSITSGQGMERQMMTV
jgi:hypothetical protein